MESVFLRATAHRFISGVIFGVLFVVGIFFRSMHWLALTIVAGAAVVGTIEFLHMAHRMNYRLQSALASAVAVATILMGYHIGLTADMIALIGLAMIGSFLIPLLRWGPERFMSPASATFLGCFYVGLPFAMGMEILNGPDYKQFGGSLLTFFILATWSSDVGAYFFGRFFGKRKLAPRLSPGKTVEGFAGGLIFSVIVACAVKLTWTILRPDMAQLIYWGEAVLLGLFFGIIGPIGDLVESAIKREAGVKDSGKNVTGHGGMLDIVDSMLFTLPVFYAYLKWVYPELR